MEGSLQVKNSTANAEEPIKLEAPVQSPDSSDRSDGAASPPPNCSICLGKLVNTSFTDSCLHQFCFTCLLQWSKIKTECPLCKQTFKSIIHNVRSEEDYDQYHVPRELAPQPPQPQVMTSFELNLEVDFQRFAYRTTMTRNRRSNHGTLLNPEQVARREQLPSRAPQVSRDERRWRRTNPTDYRRTVYRLGFWSAPLPDMFGRFRDCSAEYYRREPRELNRLIPWLNRELEVLLTNSASHIAYVMNLILEGLTQYDIRSPEFRDIVRPHLGVYTEHFAHELYTYARTNFDLVGYDHSVTYLPQGLSNEMVSYVASPPSSSSSSTSDDSSIRLLLDDSTGHHVNSTIPSVGPHSINMPGPSTIAQAFSLDTPETAPNVLTISSNSSSSDDECEVIGYVKPRHERTPEIIELSSSDPEEISSIPKDSAPVLPSFYGEPIQPSTSRPTKRSVYSGEKRPPSSTELDSDSDSHYSYRRSKCRGCHKGPARKCPRRSSNPKRHERSGEKRSHTRGCKNRSSSDESESRKRKSRRSSLRSANVRMPRGSYTSSPEPEVKKTGEKKSRNTRYSIRGSGHGRLVIKRENMYVGGDDSSSSDSSSEDEKIKSNAVRKSRRDYISSSSATDVDVPDRVKRLKSIVDRVKVRQSRARSSSESSCGSPEKRRNTSRNQESQRYVNYTADEGRSSVNNDSRKRQESNLKSKLEAAIDSSSSPEKDQFRSSSQCSNYSSASYVHRKRSKHREREKHKSKDRKRSSTKALHSSQPKSSIASTSSMSVKPDTHSTTKHSDSETSKGKHKSYKSYKELKLRRRESELESKSKRESRTRKRERYLRIFSSSNSE